MKISHEIPKQLFPVHDLINDYPYVLAHLLSDQYHYDKEYAEFYKNKLQTCEFSILDNSAYELGKSIDIEILYQLGEEYKPTHIVIPDIYSQFEPTLELVSEYSDKFGSKSTPKFFAVVQGQNLEEYVNCFEAYLKDSFIDLIGITFRSLKDGTTRESFLKHIFHFYNIYPKKIHLLGCSYPNEFLNMETKLLKNVYSVDTSSPIIHGWNGNAFTPQGCIYDKPKEKLADNLNIYLDEKQVQLIYKNINHFRNYFK